MALTSAVRCLLLTVLVILNVSGKSECSASKVKNGGETESSLGYFKNINFIPQTEDFKESHAKKYFFDRLNRKGTQDNADNVEKKTQNNINALYDRHRVRRQVRTGYPSYPQPTYSQQGQQYQSNIYKPPTNNYGNYPNVNNIYPHYNTTQYRPSNNLTFAQQPNRNNFSYPSPGFSSSSKHTYPPSPRPFYNQYPSNNRSNVSQTYNNLYPYNKNPTPYNGFNYTNNPNHYSNYNGNIYPNLNANSTYPRFGQNNTRQTFNYPNNHNTLPNYYSSNITHNPYNKYQNNSSPYNNFTQRPPLNPYLNQRNASSTYPYNLAPNTGINSTRPNNYNPGQYYPTPNFTPSAPYGTNHNLTQNNFPSNPNPFYNPSNYNGPQYDPLRQPPQRFSY